MGYEICTLYLLVRDPSFSYSTPRSSTAVQHSIVQSSTGDVSYNISEINTYVDFLPGLGVYYEQVVSRSLFKLVEKSEVQVLFRSFFFR